MRIMFRSLQFLGPRREIVTFLDTSASYFKRKQPTKITARISYRDADTQKYSETISHDLEIYRELVYEVNVIEYREGGDHLVRKLVGLRKFANIVLKRGVTESLDLYNWHRAILQGQSDRRDGTVVLLDDERKEVARWNFKDAFPCKYVGPTLNAKGNEVAIETLELCCEYMERE